MKFKNSLPPLIMLLQILFISPVLSQDTKVVKDLNLWTGIEIEKSFLTNWNVSLEQELRLKKDITEINNFFTQAGLEYNISKNFRLSGKYRFIRNHKNNGAYENKSRFAVDFKYKGEIDFISIQYRIRYQKEVESLRVFERFVPYEKYLRHRLSVRYTDIKRIKPYISGEIFQRYEVFEFPEYDQLRLIAGIKYKVKNIGVFDFAYGFEHELNSKLPYTIYLMKLNYTYKF